MSLLAEQAAVAPDAAGLATLAGFSRWMQSEQKRVFLLCRRMLDDPDEADSATQDIFFKAYRSLEKADQKAVQSPDRWLTRIAVNACLDRLRSRRWQFWRRRPNTEDETAILSMTPSGQPDAEALIFADDIRRRIKAALGRLSTRQRAVFALRHYENRSLEEIAEVLDLDTGTVKAHLARGLAKLREELRDLYGRQSLQSG